jgi:phosphoribosylformylglycinamidine synthase
MIIIPGGPALSGFRKNKVLGLLRDRLTGCRDVEARFVFFANTSEEPDPSQSEKIAGLLNLAGLTDTQTLDAAGGMVHRIVVPRIGTISPWSTKATDIFHLCGLDCVQRVERGVSWIFSGDSESFHLQSNDQIRGAVFDPMTESVLESEQQAESLFRIARPAPLETIDLLHGGPDALAAANEEFGFALNRQEQRYLIRQFLALGRNPTDVELMMFAQVNSEHCRHKIFNADWSIDGVKRDESLFSMIRHTHSKNPEGTLSAYSDNAASLFGSISQRLAPDLADRCYRYTEELVHFTAKVETHNHPTAISPFPGASTGAGGEIRDEGATGRGGKPKAGLVGYSVSHLRIPDSPQPWEMPQNSPDRIASPMQIMTEGPIGAAAFNNEFGRPNIAGYFRTFEHDLDESGMRLGYHKPIMLAGGLGNIRPGHVDKLKIPDGTPIIVLGGPTMLIGLGGGAASSVASGSSSESLDFASVQRGNPEMQRRCQEVIDACCAMGEDNPIISIHDVGAGGICNALPELVHDSDCGGVFELRKVLNDELSMSPMQIWCNESQERYVLAVAANRLDIFEKLCARERCLYATVGKAISDQWLELGDSYFDNEEGAQKPIDLPMDLLFGLPPKMARQADSLIKATAPLNFDGVTIADALERVLSFPTVGDKTFLVTIGDRSVTGLIARDQMVGPWQVPVADVGVTASGYRSYTGEAFAVGERTPLAVIDAPASGRMAIGEAVTNLAAADIAEIGNIRLSANWMAAAGEPGQDADLYATVESVALDICPKLGISIPVGKDSMSMRTVWKDNDGFECRNVSPLSLVISGFAPVVDIRNTVVPVLRELDQETDLWLLDLGAGQNRLGGSILAQAYNQMGHEPADLDSPQILKRFFSFVQDIKSQGLALAYHDRSDGGLVTTLCEMAFASRCGLSIELDPSMGNPLNVLFSEELGAVIQVNRAHREQVHALAERHDVADLMYFLGSPSGDNRIVITRGDEVLLSKSRRSCHQAWSSTTWQMQRTRDNPVCADQEYIRISDPQDQGLFCDLSFEHDEQISAGIYDGLNISTTRPKIAILREQGVNGQLEMAAAFDAVGFDAVDVTTTDLVQGLSLDDFSGFAACGGFSFGDVLGAGEGWGKSILYNDGLKDSFEQFFNRNDTFAIGVCNGCQMLSSIKQLVPGADHWPRFLRNTSEQYEARFVMVEISSEKSVLFKDMQGSRLPVSTAHGEGRAVFDYDESAQALKQNNQVCVRFIDHSGMVTERYPLNPNGSQGGLTGFTNEDGRFTIMMPHPERVFRSVSNSWHPTGWGEYSPWIKLFQNAYNFASQA